MLRAWNLRSQSSRSRTAARSCASWSRPNSRWEKSSVGFVCRSRPCPSTCACCARPVSWNPRRMARARRARDAGRRPAGRPRCRAVDADPDPARRGRARAGNPGPRRAVRAVFAQTRRYQPDGLGGRDGAAVGLRGLRSVRVGGQMIDRQQYTPGPASGAQVRKDGEKWTLILVRELRHSPEKVWQALTDPAQLREWAPFDAAGSLGTVGTRVKLTTVGAPTPHVTETTVTRADAPKVPEYNRGGFGLRWQLEAVGGGTRLTLWTNIDRRFIAMGAAGWHLCFDVLDHLLNGTPLA